MSVLTWLNKHSNSLGEEMQAMYVLPSGVSWNMFVMLFTSTMTPLLREPLPSLATTMPTAGKERAGGF